MNMDRKEFMNEVDDAVLYTSTGVLVSMARKSC